MKPYFKDKFNRRPYWTPYSGLGLHHDGDHGRDILQPKRMLLKSFKQSCRLLAPVRPRLLHNRFHDIGDCVCLIDALPKGRISARQT